MKRLPRIYKSSAGFTLIELLIAMTMSLIVTSVAGFGLTAIMSANAKAEAESQRRIDLNRALDFIVDEVRMANKIELDATVTVTGFSAVTGTSNVQRVLVLTLPGVTNRIVYYIASPPNGSVWSGDRVIYRWGPDFNGSGQYSSPGTNTNTLLVDLIDAGTPTSNPNCTTSWSPNPPVADRKGFYACVNSSGRATEVYLRGKLTGAYGNTVAPYQASTRVFARSTTCTVPNINGMTNTAANAAITTAGLVPQQNTISTGTVNSASNQSPSASSSVTCNTTVTYDYRPS